MPAGSTPPGRPSPSRVVAAWALFILASLAFYSCMVPAPALAPTITFEEHADLVDRGQVSKVVVVGAYLPILVVIGLVGCFLRRMQAGPRATNPDGFLFRERPPAPDADALCRPGTPRPGARGGARAQGRPAPLPRQRPTGPGKTTLILQALGATGISSTIVPGSTLDELYVGRGAARIRGLAEVLACACGATRRVIAVIAVIVAGPVARKLLNEVGLPATDPALARAEQADWSSP